MTKGNELLTPVKIRGFNPLTSRKHPKNRKIELKNVIYNKILEKKLVLEQIQQRCRDKPLAVKINFYLLQSDQEGNSKKDLDNLLKIFFDVLSIDMIRNNKESELKGLGLTIDDEMIYEIHATKKIVLQEEDMGFDVSIYESSSK